MAVLVKPTSHVLHDEITPRDPRGFALDELQHIVKGYIEIVRLPLDPDNRIMIVNEEGKLQGLPFNQCATRTFHKCGGDKADYIVGPAILMRESEMME